VGFGMWSADEIDEQVKQAQKEIDEIKQSAKSQIEGLLDNIQVMAAMSKEFQLFKRNYEYFNKQYEEKEKMFSYLFFTRAPETESDKAISFGEKGQQLLFSYLGAIESIGDSLVNILVMLVIASGEDFHIESRHKTPTIRHVKKIQELERQLIPLSTKISFLLMNNVRFIKRVVDTSLRNRIAHLNFKIDHDVIYIKHKPAKGKVKEVRAIPLVIKKLNILLALYEYVYDLLDTFAKSRKII
jgi:hypothetical protein